MTSPLSGRTSEKGATGMVPASHRVRPLSGVIPAPGAPLVWLCKTCGLESEDGVCGCCGALLIGSVCSWCGQTITEGGEGPVSHGLCPDCRATHFPETNNNGPSRPPIPGKTATARRS